MNETSIIGPAFVRPDEPGPDRPGPRDSNHRKGAGEKR